MTEMPEGEAIRRAKDGDEAGYEVLYQLHKRQVYSLCLRYVGNVPDAEDLTQEVFLQVYRRLSTYRGDAAFGAWLHRVAINCVRMRFRTYRLERSLTVADPADGDYRARECAFPFERAVLGRAIANLSAAKRRIVLLHDVEGLTHTEVSQHLGLAVSTSKSQLCRAHLVLRRVFGGMKRNAEGQIPFNRQRVAAQDHRLS